MGVRLVKAFAKTNGFIDAFGGFLSSTSWVLLSLAFLQKEGYLPPASRSVSDSYDWEVDLSPCLMRRFFAFVALLADQPMRISVARGECMKANSLTWSRNLPPKLLIEHP